MLWFTCRITQDYCTTFVNVIHQLEYHRNVASNVILIVIHIMIVLFHVALSIILIVTLSATLLVKIILLSFWKCIKSN